LIIPLLQGFVFFAQVDLGVMTNQQSGRHAGKEDGAQDAYFQFSHAHKVETCNRYGDCRGGGCERAGSDA
jgi:hypothetical protein